MFRMGPLYFSFFSDHPTLKYIQMIRTVLPKRFLLTQVDNEINTNCQCVITKIVCIIQDMGKKYCSRGWSDGTTVKS